MTAVTTPLTPELIAEYAQLFATCRVTPTQREPEVLRVVSRMLRGRERYLAVGKPLGIPWFLIAAIHQLECAGSFDLHLHNGNPLTDRTRDVPAGRPIEGRPPFKWEESATDALKYEQFDLCRDWSVPGLLYQLERYNGMGYRRRHVPSPYLWSASQHYTSGKFTRDGHFDPAAISQQVGAAVLIKVLVNRELIAAPK